MSDLYNELLELVIYEDSIEEYKNRRSLQESGSIIGEGLKSILKIIGVITIGPYVVMLPIAIIIAIALKISGNKKEKIFTQLNKSPEFKSYTSKLIKEIQSKVSKETKYDNYLINNSLLELNNSTADININNKTLCIKNIILYNIEKVWKDKIGMSSMEYDEKNNDNPDYCAPAPKEIKEITKDILKALNKAESKNISLGFEENVDNSFYYSAQYQRSYANRENGIPINLYINFGNIKEITNAVDKYIKIKEK